MSIKTKKIQWVHIISVDSRFMAGTIAINIFPKPLSVKAMQWFDKQIYKYVVGHLREIPLKYTFREEKLFIDSVGTNFKIYAYRDM